MKKKTNLNLNCQIWVKLAEKITQRNKMVSLIDLKLLKIFNYFFPLQIVLQWFTTEGN